MRHKEFISPAQYRHGRYGLYGAFSIVSALIVAGILVLVNAVWVVMSALAYRR